MTTLLAGERGGMLASLTPERTADGSSPRPGRSCARGSTVSRNRPQFDLKWVGYAQRGGRHGDAPALEWGLGRPLAGCYAQYSSQL